MSAAGDTGAPEPGAVPGAPVMLIDDEADMRRALAQWRSLGGFAPAAYASATAALDALDPGFPGAVVCDVKMPGLDGLGFLERARALDPGLPVILLTGHGDIAMAVAAMRAGAFDFVEKPFDPERLIELLHRAVAARAQALAGRGGVDRAGLDARLVGRSPAMARLREAVAEAAPSRASVLVTGETGSGKEVIARALHDFSERAGGPFVAVNCAAVPESMLEAEFFGHEAGSFTGASKARAGHVEAASGGTLFLDEITSLAVHLQPALLRVLQEREVTRLGARRPVAVDVRVVAATNADVETEVAAGRLRRDLYYRLATLAIEAPPLRARGEDAAELFALFAARAAERDGVEAPVLSPEDRAALATHDWPGNVRELMNLAERAVLRARRGRVALAELLGLAPAGAAGDLAPAGAVEDLAPAGVAGDLAPAGAEEGEEADLRVRVEAFERREIEAALERHRGQVGAVMRELGLPRRTLNEKMARHGLTPRDFRDP
ncbi:MAG: sigma-54-dependent transcriptional regulator [Paracoccaceae bacterium]